MADFTDLRARTLSGLAMAAAGLGAIWLGGLVFALLAVALAALMTWELHRMLAPAQPEGAALGAGLAAAMVVGVFTLGVSGWLSLAAFAATAVALALRMPRDRGVFGLYLMLILCAAHGLAVLRDGFGLAFVLWLVLIVVASDVAGYFAGRMLGGPKFWPRISPKKTWSGTIAGWLLAAAVSAGFVAVLGWSWAMVPLAVVLAFAGQMGDIAESAIKRRVGVKDASALIPGHGGVLDRFDALIAVAALALILARLGVFAGLSG